MKPKEKAIELFKKFQSVGLQQRGEGIVCALIAVDEILLLYKENIYWQEVKLEIEKL
jgi:hypothetical protein